MTNNEEWDWAVGRIVDKAMMQFTKEHFLASDMGRGAEWSHLKTNRKVFTGRVKMVMDMVCNQVKKEAKRRGYEKGLKKRSWGERFKEHCDNHPIKTPRRSRRMGDG